MLYIFNKTILNSKTILHSLTILYGINKYQSKRICKNIGINPNITINKLDTTKISDWNDFMEKYPHVIEYIDVEEQPYLLIAENVKILENMRKQMESSKNNKIEQKDNLLLNQGEKITASFIQSIQFTILPTHQVNISLESIFNLLHAP
jgi:ribosomal protein S13